jgi:hypothetical protein
MGPILVYGVGQKLASSISAYSINIYEGVPKSFRTESITK